MPNEKNDGGGGDAVLPADRQQNTSGHPAGASPGEAVQRPAFDERAEFEKVARSISTISLQRDPEDPEHYYRMTAEVAWVFWQERAAREAARADQQKTSSIEDSSERCSSAAQRAADEALMHAVRFIGYVESALAAAKAPLRIVDAVEREADALRAALSPTDSHAE